MSITSTSSSHPSEHGPASSDCLSDELIGMLSDGELPDEELARAHRHAAGCHACRKLLVELAHGGLDGDPADSEEKPEEEGPGNGGPGKGGAGADAPVEPWTPPMEFDEFRLERPLGRGGMGVVYLAHDTKLGRSVAVKFIADSNPKPWVLKSFEEEARSISPLQHPNVVRVYRTGVVGGHPYIVSEYITGRRLADLPLPVPWRQALILGLGLARGLAAAHRLGVLHRDIKPSNALVTREGEVKLLDFGLAERFEQVPTSPPPGQRLLAGTPLYMAPEVLNRAPATPQSDIYALGLVLHELCTGALPLREPAKAAQPPAPAKEARPSGRNPVIDPAFTAIIQRCLALDPRERFASADALCEALERLERASAPAPLDQSNPYRGLAPFEAEHRALFFGRDADIHAVLDRLRHQPLVLVAGDSGAGKSSLCRAGVLPRVAASVLDESREMSTVTLWPGRRPLEALAAALAPFLGRKEEELVTVLADTPAWLGRALREAHQEGRGLLLFIDQLEELITVADPDQAMHVARILGELALPAAGVRVLLAVRGDFLTRVCALPGLGDAAERALYILRPLSPEGVREAVAGPARSRGVVFESAELVQSLVASTVHGAGSLPLLQFALAELWERRDPAWGCITQAALEEMGGVAGALSRHADGVLARLSTAERDAARRLLLRLVTMEGTRVERGEEELVDDAASRAALRALVEGRLLHARTVGGEARCGIAHDSLIESWGTLRDWLDDDIGHKVVRKRLEAASAEWERLMRAREALWGQRLLDEARPLDPATLGPRELAFLEHSRRAVARQRRRRWFAVFVVSLAIALSYGGPRLQTHLMDARFVAAQGSLAREALTQGRALAEQASARREEALALFDGRALATGRESAHGTHGLRDAAERRWAEALVLREQADAAYTRAIRELERALDRDRGHAGTRQRIAEATYERVLLAERFHQRRERDERAQRLVEVTEAWSEGGEWLQRLQAPAELELMTDPPGASVTIERYTDIQGVLRREPVPEARALGTTPIAQVRLPEGSYHLRFTHPGRAPVELPLLLTHGAHEQVRLTLPARVPVGYRYIAPGCFLLGSAEPEEVRIYMLSSPLHRFCLTEGYWIGKTEVTFGDWIAYLETLPPGSPVRRILEQPRFGAHGRAITLRQQPGGGWSFAFYISREGVITAREGESFVYPGRTRNKTADWRRFPLSGVSAEDLVGYFYWLDHSGRLPGARLCSQTEWEYAARGADGRRYPHGDQLQPDDANIDVTYGRQLTDFGPDMVEAHPASVSPFGLMDMSGNALELTRSVTPELGRVILRGGGWYYDSFGAHLANLSSGDPTQRDAGIGVRVCAPATAR